jgi:hypothetical protein
VENGFISLFCYLSFYYYYYYFLFIFFGKKKLKTKDRRIFFCLKGCRGVKVKQGPTKKPKNPKTPKPQNQKNQKPESPRFLFLRERGPSARKK